MTFEYIYQTWQPLVRSFLLHRLGNVADAEDLMQETFARAWKAWDRFDGANVRSWLLQIAQNLFLDVKRREHIVQMEPLERPTPDGGLALEFADQANDYDSLLMNDDLQYLQRGLYQLPSAHARAIRVFLRSNGALPLAAAELGTTVQALKALLCRAKTQLRDRQRKALLDAERTARGRRRLIHPVVGQSPTRPRGWTSQEDAVLLRWWGSEPRRQTATRLGRTALACAHRVFRLRRSASPHAKYWTQEENDLLLTWWGIEPRTTTAHRIGRGVNACKQRAKRMRIPGGQQRHYTAADVAAIFGTSESSVTRSWLTEDMLGEAYQERPMAEWRISGQAIHGLITRRPWFVDWTRMREPWRTEALEALRRTGLIRLADAANRLGVAPWKALKLANAGRLGPISYGRQWGKARLLFVLADVVERYRLQSSKSAICPVCGESFPRVNHSQRYCSAGCKHLASRQRKHEWRQRRGSEVA